MRANQGTTDRLTRLGRARLCVASLLAGAMLITSLPATSVSAQVDDVDVDKSDTDLPEPTEPAPTPDEPQPTDHRQLPERFGAPRVLDGIGKAGPDGGPPVARPEAHPDLGDEFADSLMVDPVNREVRSQRQQLDLATLATRRQAAGEIVSITPIDESVRRGQPVAKSPSDVAQAEAVDADIPVRGLRGRVASPTPTTPDSTGAPDTTGAPEPETPSPSTTVPEEPEPSAPGTTVPDEQEPDPLEPVTPSTEPTTDVPDTAPPLDSTPTSTVPVVDELPVDVIDTTPEPDSGAVDEDPSVVPDLADEVSTEAVGSRDQAAGLMQLEVLDEETTAGLGLEKLAFTIVADSNARVAKGEQLLVSIDYSSFRNAYGADWAGRLRVMSFDSCYTEKKLGCRRPQPVDPKAFDVVNDTRAGVISFVLTADQAFGRERIGAQNGPVGFRQGTTGGPGFGFSADAYSATGNYATSNISSTGDWSVGLQSGNFEYSYPLDIPAPPAGPTPGMAFSYSSQAIDGLTSTVNTQGGKLGPGWSIGEMFIERRYVSCFNDDDNLGGTGDLCYADDNATVSMNGVNGELVLGASEGAPGGWEVKRYLATNAPGWHFKYFRRTNATGSRGAYGVDNDGEHWAAIGPDGTTYWFGYGNRTGGFNPGTSLQSNWTVPVRGLHPSEPCYNLSSKWCHQTWRWNLDRIVSPDGALANYVYAREQNYYGLMGSPNNSQPYVSGGRIERIDYGMVDRGASTNSQGSATRTHAIELYYHSRCSSLTAACPAPTKTNGSQFPDIPNDQICTGNPCYKYSPTFFDRMYLRDVATMVRTPAGSFQPMRLYRPRFIWLDTDGGGDDPARLWMHTIDHYAYNLQNGWGGDWLGNTRLGGGILNDSTGDSSSRPFANRVDYSSTVSEMKYWRLGHIRDEVGTTTVVEYMQPKNCASRPSPAWAGNRFNTWSCFVRWWNPPAGPAGPSMWHKYVVDKVTVHDLAQHSMPIVTDYEYPTNVNRPGIPSNALNGGMAWAADKDRYVDENKYWSRYRGFAEVLVHTGIGSEKTTSVHRFFRGMHGDKTSHDAGTPLKSVSLYTGLPSSTSYNAPVDYEWLAGRPLETFQPAPGYVPGQVGNRSTHASWSVERYVKTRDQGTDPRIWWVEPDITYSGQNGAFSLIDRDYDGSGRLISTKDRGAVNGSFTNVNDSNNQPDHRCSRVYYNNTTNVSFPLSLPVREVLLSGADCNGAVLSDVRTFYDGNSPTGSIQGQTLGAGKLTATVTMTGGGVVNDAGVALDRLTETYTYEPNGYASTPGWARIKTSTDSRNQTTTYGYTSHASAALTTPNVVHALKFASVTNPLGHVTSTEFDVYGNNVATVDVANNRRVEACYDKFFRITHVLGPADPKPGGEHFRSNCSETDAAKLISYTAVDVTSPVWPFDGQRWVINETSRFEALRSTVTRTILDGHGRTTQVHSPAVNGGTMITASAYDSAGRQRHQTTPFHYNAVFDLPNNAAPNVIQVGSASDVEQDNVTLFDWANRPVQQRQYFDGVYTRFVDISYSGLDVTTSAVRTNTWNPYASTTVSYDVRGRAIRSSSGGAVSKTYYNPRGDITAQYQPDGTVAPTEMSYNLLGWRTELDHTEAGRSTTSYLPNGVPYRSTDANGQSIYTKVDALGRVTETSISSAFGAANRLSYFTYDPAGNVGSVRLAHSYQPAGTVAFRSWAKSFDDHGRVTNTELRVYAGDDPETAGDELLNDPITLLTTYTEAGLPKTTTLPGKSGWSLSSPEVLEFKYNEFGMQVEATSDLANYITATTFTNEGEVETTSLRGVGSTGINVNRVYRDDTHALGTVAAIVSGGWRDGETAASERYSYDRAGNPTESYKDPFGAAGDERECFYYDSRQRLIRGFTTALTDPRNCPTAVGQAINPTGTDPYLDIYAYSNSDDITSFDGRSYTYNPSVSGLACSSGTEPTKPKALSTISAGNGAPSETFGYDCNGSIIDRTQTLDGATVRTAQSWNEQNKLVATSLGSPVTWTNMVDVAVDGSTQDLVASSSVPGTGYSAGASSVESIGQHGAFSFRRSGSPAPRQLVGLNDADNTTSFQELDYAFYVIGTNLRIYEGSSYRGQFSTRLDDDDILSIQRTGTEVAYLLNGDIVYRSTVPATASEYVVDSSFFHPNTRIGDVTIVNDQPVTWTNTTNVTVGTNNELTATTGGYSAGATSVETLPGSGSVSFSYDRQGSYSGVLGLNNNPNAGTSWQELDYSIWVSGNGNVHVYENGSNVCQAPGACYWGQLATAQDVFSIDRSGSTVRYLRNGVVFHTSTQTATGTYYLDAALGYSGARATNVTISNSGSGVSRNVYGPDGMRVMRIDPSGIKTMYLGSTELRWEPGSTAVKTARSYPGGTRRGFDGAVTYSVSGRQGSAIGTINGATGKHNTIRYTPYGATRTGTLIDDKGFLGQTHDPNQALVYLNNRHYDPTTGLFVSVDPLVTMTGEPYIYGAANPVRLSDPSGLCVYGCEEHYEQVSGGSPVSAPPVDLSPGVDDAIADAVDAYADAPLARCQVHWSAAECNSHVSSVGPIAYYPESESMFALGELFRVGPVDLVKILLCGSDQRCQIGAVRDSGSNIGGASLDPLHSAVVGEVLTWAGAVSSEVCGASASGADVHCVAVTRLPSMQESAHAITLGRIILYDITEPGESYVQSDGSYSLRATEPILLRHELGHVNQFEAHGSDFTWLYLMTPRAWECAANSSTGTTNGRC